MTLTESVHLVAGKAFAKGLEVTRKAFYRDKLSQEEALLKGARALIKEYGSFECPDDSNKSFPNMLLALYAYFDKYGMATDHVQPFYPSENTPAIEFSFALPLEINHPVTKQPILYFGRFDLLGIYNGQLYAVDEKTTGRLGASWRSSWHNRGQFTGYCWAAQQYGYPVTGAIVRGMSILKNSYGHEEVPEPRDKWMIERWYEQLHWDIERMIKCWETDHWDYDMDSACSAYGGCAFLGPCTSRQPMRWLQEGFIKDEWTPLGNQR